MLAWIVYWRKCNQIIRALYWDLGSQCYHQRNQKWWEYESDLVLGKDKWRSFRKYFRKYIYESQEIRYPANSEGFQIILTKNHHPEHYVPNEQTWNREGKDLQISIPKNWIMKKSSREAKVGVKGALEALPNRTTTSVTWMFPLGPTFSKELIF